MIRKHDTAPCRGKKLLLFQQLLLDLDRGNYRVLADDQFVDELVDYMTQLARLGHKDIVLRIFTKLARASKSNNENLGANIRSIADGFQQKFGKAKDEYAPLTTSLKMRWQ